VYEAKRRGKRLFVTLDSLEAKPVELVPAADTDTLMSQTFGNDDLNRHFPLPLRPKSV
jgi:hypothetical protein